MKTIQVLQAVRLKGRPTTTDLAAATRIPQPEVESELDALADAGLVVTGPRHKVTQTGRDRLTELLNHERAEVEQLEMRALYDEFDSFNRDFKELITDWQLIDGQPNDHSDVGYDNTIVTRLVQIDVQFTPLLDKMITTAPRLSPYRPRFADAVRRVVAGDHSWVARPMADSYHTVWFELHEDLIGLSGLSRADEAAAGRAE